MRNDRWGSEYTHSSNVCRTMSKARITCFRFIFMTSTPSLLLFSFICSGFLRFSQEMALFNSVYHRKLKQQFFYDHNSSPLEGQALNWSLDNEQKIFFTITDFILYTLLTSQCDQRRKMRHRLKSSVHCSKKTLI